MFDYHDTARQLSQMLALDVEHSAITAGHERQNFVDWHGLAHLLGQVMAQPKCRIIGVSGSQGSGKSTLSRILAEQASEVTGQSCVSLSLDDYYLSQVQRAGLAQRVHPLLQTRGVPGTHDVQWLRATLNQVGQQTSITYPRFDKAADNPAAPVEGVIDKLVLEGWCLGVSPQPETELAAAINVLEQQEDPAGTWRRWVNQQIEDHYLALWAQVDFWVHLRMPSFAQVLEWRSLAERQLAPQRQMSTTQLQRFVAHYERLTRWLWDSPWPTPGVLVELDTDHNVMAVQVGQAPT